MRPIGTAALLLVCLGGCREDRCRSFPAAVQIDLRLQGISPGVVAGYDVALAVNARPPIVRRFAEASPPSFAFQFGRYDEAPRQLTILASAFDAAGRVVGEGQRSTTFSSDACNQIEVAIGPPGPRVELGIDAGRPDALARDLHLLDAAADRAAPEARPGDLAPPDLTPMDSARDLAPSDLSPVDIARDLAPPDQRPPDAPKGDAPKGDGPPCTAPKPPAGVAATRIVSAASGDDSKASGTCVAYKTIGAALKGAAQGAVVWVESGMYDGESFPLGIPPGVTLIGDSPTRGEGPPATVIRGSGPALTGHQIHVAISLLNAGGKVEGFRIEAGSTAADRFGVFSYGSSVTLARNSFGASHGGITVAYGPTTGKCVKIEDNRFASLEIGITSNCKDVLTVINNELKQVKQAVDLYYGDKAVITGNAFIDAGTYGISVYSPGLNDAPLIKDNAFTGSGYSVAAILLSGVGVQTLRQNLFQLSAGSGPAVLLGFQSTGVVDLGTLADAGKNDFTTAPVGIQHQGATAVSAIGNLWPAGGPICGTQIKTPLGGTVTWGAAGEACP